jgi:predicted aldo/keto reductase-like oxidoreductase
LRHHRRLVSRDLEAVVDFKSDTYTLSQAKLKSVWANERISSIVSEMDSVQRVRENVKAARSERSLTAQESHQLNRLAAMTSSYACNGCSHLCEQAAGGSVAIADTLRYLMYHECYDGKSGRAKELYARLPAGACTADARALQRANAACPQGIDIAARLNQAQGSTRDTDSAPEHKGQAQGTQTRPLSRASANSHKRYRF